MKYIHFNYLRNPDGSQEHDGFTGIAFATFRSRELAQSAIKTLHGFSLDGQHLSAVCFLTGPTNANPQLVDTKPKIVHQVYSKQEFKWQEFNPEDTVVGDETDPFIVYLRHETESIGSKRDALILPKHPLIVHILQDCLPDYDWRMGEDLMVFP